MNRQIKFRGRRIDNGEWVYGDLVRNMSFNPDARPTECAICWDNDFVPIDPETVGQFTGLTDKNGKEIWEGDIVFFHYNENNYIGEVLPSSAFHGNYVKVLFTCVDFCGQPMTDEEYRHLSLESKKPVDVWYCEHWWHSKEYNTPKYGVEVIGTIYENPELLTPPQ